MFTFQTHSVNSRFGRRYCGPSKLGRHHSLGGWLVAIKAERS